MRTWGVIAVSCAFSTSAVVAVRAQIDVARTLERAGFVMSDADTPKKMASLRAMPGRKFVARKSGNTTYYVFADPECRCAFVGSQQAMQRYTEMVSIPQAPPGYQTPTYEDDTRASGVNPMSEIVNDMDDDLDSVDDDEFFAVTPM